MLDEIGTQIGVECNHFHRYTSDPPTFALVTPTHTIQFGNVDGILNWYKFKAAIFQVIGDVMVPRFKQPQWDSITAMIGKCWEDQDVGLESTDAGQMLSWVSEYLEQRPPVPEAEEAVMTHWPYIDANGRTVLFLYGFKRWLFIQHRENFTDKALGTRLKQYGAEYSSVNLVIEGKRTSRSIWRLPAKAVPSSELGPKDEDDE